MPSEIIVMGCEQLPVGHQFEGGHAWGVEIRGGDKRLNGVIITMPGLSGEDIAKIDISHCSFDITQPIATALLKGAWADWVSLNKEGTEVITVPKPVEIPNLMIWAREYIKQVDWPGLVDLGG